MIDPDPGENGSLAEMNVRAEAKLRARIVETARAICIRVSASSDNYVSDLQVKALIADAEVIERTLAEYLRGQS